MSLLDALFTVAPTLHQQMQAGLADRDLSLSRAVLLWQVAADGPVKQRDLAQALRVVPRTVTGIVDDLVAAGLLARVPHPTDRRAVLVSLTAEGQQLMSRLTGEREALADQLCVGLTSADLETAASVVGQVSERLVAVTAPSAAAVAS